MRRDHERVRGTVPVDGVDERRGVPPGQRDDRRAQREMRDRERPRSAVVRRPGEQMHVVDGEAPQLDVVGACARRGRLLVDDPLGATGRPRRVEHEPGRRGAGRRERIGRRAGERLVVPVVDPERRTSGRSIERVTRRRCERTMADEHAGVRVSQDPADLAVR